MSNLQSLLEQQSRHASVEGKENRHQYLSSCLPHLTSEFREAADAFLELDSSVRCPVHSQLLSAYSEALCRALTANTGEQKVLRLRGCDARDLVNILESIYSRGSRVKTVDAAVSLTKLADTFNDGTLRAECDAFLTRSADRPCSILAPQGRTGMALKWALYAEKYGLQHLAATCERFIMLHFMDMAGSPELEQLSKAALLRIAHGLAAALEPWLGRLECSSCGSQTTTTWCEGRSCREITGRNCSGTFHVKDHAFPPLRSWAMETG